MAAHRKDDVSDPHHSTAPDVAATGGDVGDAIDPRGLGSESESERHAKRIVPWLISFAVHAAIVFLGFMLTWTVVQMRGEGEASLIVSDVDSVTFEPVVSDVFDDAETDDPFEEAFELAPSDMPADELFVDLDSAPMNLAPPEVAAAGNPADFTPPPVQGSVSFMGLSAHDAQRIVYVIDASGRMIAYLQFVIQELERSLEALQPHQEFAVVFIHRNEAVIAPPRRLVPAGARERYRTLEWIERNIVPAGRSNPVAALDAALQLSPDVVFVLSGNITGAGIYEVDQAELLARLDQLNPRHRLSGQRPTAINCIQFLDPDELDTLRKVAEEHSGPEGYKFVSRRELGLAR